MLKLTLVLITALLVCVPLEAATRTVDDDGGADFTSIQPAIDASSAGDIVYVFPGTYNGPITMKDEVNLFGYGPHVTTIDGQGTANNVVTYSGVNGAVISGFRITGSVPSGPWYYSGIYCQAGPLTVKNNIIEGNHGGVSVLSAGNPSIINNTIVGNTNGIILSPRVSSSVPEPRQLIVAYIYEIGASADSFGALLMEAGIAVDLISVPTVYKANLSQYDAIIVANDTGNGVNWGDERALGAIVASEKPVLGIGEGGYAYFGKLGLATGFGNGAHSSDDQAIAVNTDHEIFHSPQSITIPRGNILTLYNTNSGMVMINLPQIPKNVVVLGEAVNSASYYPLTLENGTHLLWGFGLSPASMTETGSSLFINAVYALIRRCYYNLPDPEIVATGSQDLGNGYRNYLMSVINWASFPDELFEPAPYLEPCGLTTDSPRTWVDIFAEDGTWLYGFCERNNAEELKDGMGVVIPNGEDPPRVYLAIRDRRCNISYTSNVITLRRDRPVNHVIMNNIIVNNSNAGIFYYVHSTDGDILYNDVWGNSGRNYNDNHAPGSFVPLPGTGEISANPLFEDTVDYFLGDGSPCRDTGHPGAQYLDPDATRNDMGAFGGPQASGRGTHPGSGFIFTSIGNIPASEIEQDPGHPSHALADVDAATASDLHIPAYADAPFGATLRIHGLFGETDIANGVRYYQILLAPWDAPDDPPEPEDYEPLATGLSKVKYIPQPDATVLTQIVTLGPQTISGITNLYKLTYQGWWSQIDLRMIWNTRNKPNGKYTLTYKAYRYHPLVPGLLVEYFPTANDLDHIDLLVNNSSVQAVIHNVKYDTSSPHWSEATDGEIPECGIINLQNDAENLRFNITARHPDGYLRRWVLDALWGKNHYAGVIASDNYPGTVPPNNWHGVSTQEFNSEDGSLVPWQPCAYQFRLRAYTRATNGYGYLTSTDPIDYSETFSDHYFIDLGGSCAWCGGADINRDGTVDMEDLAIMGLHFLDPTPCGPDCP